jgi:DNA-directed RNA polymerase subunit RPC12/RpoP
MARREIKLLYTEKPMACPHCRVPLMIGTVMGKIVQSTRNCPKCGKEFLIENDAPKKPPKSIKR